MFEALFILTTVDAGTRVGALHAAGRAGQPLRAVRSRDPAGSPAPGSASAVVVAAWGYILLMGVTDPLGGINTLFPLFGIANQLLAAIALTVGTVVLIKRAELKWAWITGVPLAWDAAVTLTASYQKVFSADPTHRLLRQCRALFHGDRRRGSCWHRPRPSARCTRWSPTDG